MNYMKLNIQMFAFATETLHFETNGGNALDDVVYEDEYFAGYTFDLTEYVPTRDGYIFVGWCSDSDLTNIITSVDCEENATVTVYAKWKTIHTKFNGNTLEKIIYNGMRVKKLIYNGIVIFEDEINTLTPINEDISYLYPNNDLYPSDDLYPASRDLIIEDMTTSEIVRCTLPCDLLYLDSNTYDELVLDNSKLKLYCIHRVGLDSSGNKYALDNEEIEYFDYVKISLDTSIYHVYMESGTSINLMIQAKTNSTFTIN